MVVRHKPASGSPKENGRFKLEASKQAGRGEFSMMWNTEEISSQIRAAAKS